MSNTESAALAPRGADRARVASVVWRRAVRAFCTRRFERGSADMRSRQRARGSSLWHPTRIAADESEHAILERSVARNGNRGGVPTVLALPVPHLRSTREAAPQEFYLLRVDRRILQSRFREVPPVLR